MRKKKNTLMHVVALLMSFCLALGAAIPAFAATENAATVDTDRATSLTLYKYDLTSATDDGAWDISSYVSTGICDDDVNSTLSKYAIQGVEFSYIHLADLSIYKGESQNGHQEVVPLYAFSENTVTNSREIVDFLAALGLTTNDAYRTDHDSNQNRIWYFESDILINALADALRTNATGTKATLESYLAENGGTALPETDANGKTGTENLAQGLYLLVETKVPENVVDTTDPFLVSLPMTTVDGSEWNYDVTVYPKNETGNPTLEKTVRESNANTGKNSGKTDDITDGYAHTATASGGDAVEYQIISTLPTITSPATALSTYTFVDQLSKGIQYNTGDVKIEFFKDIGCTEPVTAWTEADGKFAVEYRDYDPETGSVMTISMTADGLKEINSAETVYDPVTSLLRGYSNCTMRITYSCTINSNATVVCGDSGNPNDVELEWRRTNTTNYDTLRDDCHVFSYGVDLTKHFSDDAGNYDNVKFLLHNTTDGYYVQAAQNESEGIYYVTGHTAKESEATLFSPMSGSANHGRVIVKGLEDDTYIITETATDSGYVLLAEDITVVISQAENTADSCKVCGKAMLTASGTVNGSSVEMTEDNSSINAIVPLSVMNTNGFDLPKTGENGALVLFCLGILVCIAGGIILLAGIVKVSRHGKEKNAK